MLDPKFAKAVKSNQGHIYLKVLRQKVFEELKLTEPTTFDEFDWYRTKEMDYYR